MNKPNLFKVATKELSHDAFFTWLLSWANKNYESVDFELNKAAKNFVKMLLKNENYTKEIETIKVWRQHEGIDIVTIINDDFFVIIEDKTNTNQHSDQLQRYSEIATKYATEKNLKLIKIYLKTGNESNAHKKVVEDNNFRAIYRSETLECLRKENVKNPIYSDYLDYLQSIENETQLYQNLPIKAWQFLTWQGFYSFLENECKIGIVGWEYVANASGGFVGCWWHFTQKSDCQVYLQFEERKLCVKLCDTNEKQRSEMRNKWHNLIMKQAKEKGLSELKRPDRFGYGEYMTIASINLENFLGDGKVDFDKFLKLLKNMEALVENCVD